MFSIALLYQHLLLPAALVDTVLAVVNLLRDPVILPAVISGVMWLVSTYSKFVAGLPNLAKIAVMAIVPALLAQGAAAIGVDISSVSAAAAGLVAAGVFQLGKLKGQAS